MSKLFRKQFADRAVLLHEQQILEYLNQRRAPVPEIKFCNFSDCYLEMSFEGMDLSHWLKYSYPGEQQIRQVLVEALDAVLAIARLGVWHLDIASRNILVRESLQGRSQVLVIDFSNSISTAFPLHKPLWMRPSHLQHSSLQHALIEDWSKFFSKNGLIAPTSWFELFEVPRELYQSDWGKDFSVELINCRLCVLLHGFCMMLEREVFSQSAKGMPLVRDGVKTFLEIKCDYDAERKYLPLLKSILQICENEHHATPRPGIEQSLHLDTPPKKIENVKKIDLVKGTANAKSLFGWCLNILLVLCALSPWLIIDAVFAAESTSFGMIGWFGLVLASLGPLQSRILNFLFGSRLDIVTVIMLSQIGGQIVCNVEYLLNSPSFRGFALILGSIFTNILLVTVTRVAIIYRNWSVDSPER
jgi:serine/threonine protein kinase